jgi:hypothetical protein
MYLVSDLSTPMSDFRVPTPQCYLVITSVWCLYTLCTHLQVIFPPLPDKRHLIPISEVTHLTVTGPNWQTQNRHLELVRAREKNRASFREQASSCPDTVPDVKHSGQIRGSLPTGNHQHDQWVSLICWSLPISFRSLLLHYDNFYVIVRHWLHKRSPKFDFGRRGSGKVPGLPKVRVTFCPWLMYTCTN